VLLAEMVDALRPAPGGRYLDVTYGRGGYARAILARNPAQVVGIDRDPAAVADGLELAAQDSRFSMVEGCFGEVAARLANGGPAFDGIVADLGVSSAQLDTAERGFSFQHDAPLDMRMGAAGPTAAELLAGAEVAELARLFRRYGDEPQAARIARAIVARRQKSPVTRTGELRELVAAIKGRHGPRDPATQVFQALRIAVNDELGELERLLASAADLLRPGGRLVIVTFHSGEDRLVKQFIDAAGGRSPNPSRHRPPAQHDPARFAWVERGVVRPTPAEVAANSRARSAKLRTAVRLDDGRHGEGACDTHAGAAGGYRRVWAISHERRCAA
jgi:16S rRNA (cytosine1402-N4)-methyltransferase